MPELSTFEYNPEEAKRLLKEAGYNGFAIRFDTAATYYTNGLLAAQAIQEMWAAVGVKAEIKVEDRWTGQDADMMARNWSNPMYFPEPAAAWGLLELDDTIAFRVFGREPFAATLDAAVTARRWITPLSPFDELPEIRARRAAGDRALKLGKVFLITHKPQPI